MAAKKEAWKTYGNVFDEFTNQNLFKLASQGYFDELTSSLSLGKEANIFLATKKDGTRVIVKIYRLENCNFNKMYSYIKSDPRYQHLKGRRREIIFNWVQREFRNLHIAREAGVRVPTPYVFLKNIIVMEYIGDEEPSLQAKSCALENPQAFIDDLLSQIRLLYKKGKLIHGDLSMFNILVRDELPVIIDMSQSTSIEDPNFKEYFDRDLVNVVTLAKRFGLDLTQEKIEKIILK